METIGSNKKKGVHIKGTFSTYILSEKTFIRAQAARCL